MEHIKKEEIYDLLKNCDILERAIVLVGISSGLFASDIMALKIKDFKNGYDPESKITTLPLTRTKTGVKFVTFLSPEASQAVIDYLKFRSNEATPKQHDSGNNGHLFIPRKISKKYNNDDPSTEELRKLTEVGFTRMHARLAEKANKINPNGWNVVRSHQMRKFFFTTLMQPDTGCDFFFVDRLMGHKPTGSNNSYFKCDPVAMKEEYKRCIPYLTISKESVSVIDSKEYKELLAEKEIYKKEAIESKIERYEYTEMKAKVDEIAKRITDSIDDWL